MLFTLDDTMEEKEWGSIHTEVGTTVCTQTTALSSLRDDITWLAKYNTSVLPTFIFPFRAPNPYPLYSPLWLAARSNPCSFVARRTFGAASPTRHGYVRG
jgi:hypothetical protein